MQDDGKPQISAITLEVWDAPVLNVFEISVTEGGVGALQEADGGNGMFS